MGKGASLRDRATHEQSPQAVSAVPVGIPSAACCAIALADALLSLILETQRHLDRNDDLLRALDLGTIERGFVALEQLNRESVQ